MQAVVSPHVAVHMDAEGADAEMRHAGALHLQKRRLAIAARHRIHLVTQPLTIPSSASACTTPSTAALRAANVSSRGCRITASVSILKME